MSLDTITTTTSTTSTEKGKEKDKEGGRTRNWTLDEDFVFIQQVKHFARNQWPGNLKFMRSYMISN